MPVNVIGLWLDGVFLYNGVNVYFYTMNDSGTIPMYNVINSSEDDMDTIFYLFDEAINYQKKKGYELWPQFSRAMILNEINNKQHWKIMEGNRIVAVLSVLYNDPVIWGVERDAEPAVYLHRIAINPEDKGKGMMKFIKHWAENHARAIGKKYLRMDTWGNNINLRQYYIDCGFEYIGQQQLVVEEGMQPHYGGLVLSLFQNEVG
ncbi:MAG: GNAT family N-acetyltransferase [Bacteroidota bacterium]